MPQDHFQWRDPFLGSPKTEMVTGSVPDDSLTWSGASWGRVRPLAMHYMVIDFAHTVVDRMRCDSPFLQALAALDRV